MTPVESYLAALPDDRRATLAAVREVMRANLDPVIEEGIQYGMIGYFIPHAVYPAGYHADPRQPLPFAALAAQKSHLAIYLHALYAAPALVPGFAAAWKATGKKLDMGKSCVRFKTLADVPLDVLAELLRRLPAKDHLARYADSLPPSKRR